MKIFTSSLKIIIIWQVSLNEYIIKNLLFSFELWIHQLYLAHFSEGKLRNFMYVNEMPGEVWKFGIIFLILE